MKPDFSLSSWHEMAQQEANENAAFYAANEKMSLSISSVMYLI